MRLKPEVICLCGPTRFREDYRRANAALTAQGYVVHSVGVFKGDPELDTADKAMLDELHLRKIDLSDIVVFIGGHAEAGDSTKREIEYAFQKGKLVSEWRVGIGGLHGMNAPEEQK